MDDAHIESGLLTELFAHVPRRLAAVVVSYLQRLQLLAVMVVRGRLLVESPSEVERERSDASWSSENDRDTGWKRPIGCWTFVVEMGGSRMGVS